MKDIDFGNHQLVVRNGKEEKIARHQIRSPAQLDVTISMTTSCKKWCAGLPGWPISANRYPLTPSATFLQRSYYKMDNFRTVQELLGHKYVKTTMIYTHVQQHGAGAVISPFGDR